LFYALVSTACFNYLFQVFVSGVCFSRLQTFCTPASAKLLRELIRREFSFTSRVVFGIIFRRWDRQGALRMAKCNAGSVCRPDKEAVAT